VIAIECKAETSKHESVSRDQYSDYAVDGALLYAAYLAKDYDVLAIAVSGQNVERLKISHFLHLKGTANATPIFANVLLPPEDYLDGYIKSPEKFRQDYNCLLEFAQQLNENLHTHKIVESDRALLLSCVLIALESKGFSSTYQSYTNPKQLADYLTLTVKNEFQNAKLDAAKLEVLMSRFAFITTDTTLSKKDQVLRAIIDDVDNNIKNFIKTHEFFDVLGQLYIEFLRYANSDKGLGIVLTPPHITEFMAQLAEVNKDSVIYDNCTGTGGFLVSAMKQMILDAKGDQTKIKNIKHKQLVGVEYQAHVFALACSNMFIHQDGKTNILNGSCFDRDIIDQIKKFHPTVGLLNPPYKGDKKKDTDELEFILNNLECLEQGGRCVAIVPTQAALATSGKVYEYKQKLLNAHTLEAVFSMPNEVFFNSKVGVVACVMVFTAKRPHPKNKEVYLGYYKEDGFVKRKHLGRIDLCGEFENRIKHEWISHWINHKATPGLSVCRTLSANDEWCAELYMTTDYSLLQQGTFEKKIRDYVAYRVRTAIRSEKEQVLGNRIVNKSYSLDTRNWQWFRYDSLFKIVKGKRLTKADMMPGNIPFIGATEFNNGVTAYVDSDKYIHQENLMTVSYNGSVGMAFYQPQCFFACDDVNVLYPKFQLNPYIAMFLTALIELEKYRYNYGLKWTKEKMEQSFVKLPVQSDGTPDWEYMESYIKSLPYSGNL
jgi:type I restriction-modification system DNA methylase subunit